MDGYCRLHHKYTKGNSVTGNGEELNRICGNSHEYPERVFPDFTLCKEYCGVVIIIVITGVPVG